MPMEKQGIFVYRFDYELKGNPWTAYVAGYGSEECQEYLIETVGDINVISIGQECALHAISNQLRQKILETNTCSIRNSGKQTKSSRGV